MIAVIRYCMFVKSSTNSPRAKINYTSIGINMQVKATIYFCPYFDITIEFISKCMSLLRHLFLSNSCKNQLEDVCINILVPYKINAYSRLAVGIQYYPAHILALSQV